MRLKPWIAGLILLGTGLTGQAEPPAATVAVLDFSAPAADSNHWAWAAGGVADLLQIELQQRGVLLLDRDAIHAVLNEQRLTTVGLTAGDQLAVAKLLNARYLITGKVIPLAGGRLRVEASAFSVEAVETEVTATGEGDFPKDLSLLLANVARQIAGKLPAHNEFSIPKEPAGWAPKPEALIMFYRGLNACAGGQPAWGAACFMNAASLDPDFTVPLLWEIKAYELAGFPELAALRHQELAEALPRLVSGVAGRTNTLETSTRPVLAVLNPLVTAGVGGLDAATLGGALTRSLLATDRVRVFAFEGIGAAVAEQDLQLSSLFSRQNAPRYGRWLAADGLVLCRVQPAGTNRVVLELSLINPLNAVVMARAGQTVPANELPGQLPALAGRLLADWTNRPATKVSTAMATEPITPPADEDNPGLRPVYVNLVSAMNRVRHEPGNSDAHRALADAFAANGRPRLAAHEIEQCLKTLDIHAPHADTTFLGTHRWLFWQPSPASGAVGLVAPSAITNLIGRLLAVYPQSLAVGCLRYNMAVSAWQAGNWADSVTQARQSRRVLQAVVAQYDRNATTDLSRGSMECEMLAATYFLEGASLEKSGKPEEARAVFHQGLDFMQAFKVRNFCLPYGPYIGDFFGGQRVYGYGGDPPGIQTRLEQELARLGETHDLSTPNTPPPAAAGTKATGVDWTQKGQLEFQNENYLAALECYQKAMAAGTPANACPGLPAALLEIALDRDLDHPQGEIETLRRQMGFPPVEASWVDWFAAGRKYQAGSQFDYQKAAACYRGALNFLEHPEQMGIYRLEKQPNCDRVALRWGPGLREEDLLWSENYDRRWYSAAFYLAQCLIKLDRPEEAAQWLRKIALNAGGDNIPLLERDNWNSRDWKSGERLGTRAAEMLQALHQEAATPKFGEADGPFKVPGLGWKAQHMTVPPLPPTDPGTVQALTNTLVEAARVAGPPFRNPWLQDFIQAHGHDGVPAELTLLFQPDGTWDEHLMAYLLDQTATSADATWIVPACAKHWDLIALAERLDPAGTANALAEEWQEHSGASFEPPGLVIAIMRAQVRPLYALVLGQVAEKRVNHPVIASEMEKVVLREKSDELESGFREALARCLKLKFQTADYYELRTVSLIALRHGVPEGIDGLATCEGASPANLRADLQAVLDLPGDDQTAMAFLQANRSHWEWRPDRNKFEPAAMTN